MSIPVVDLADFLSGDAQRRAAFVQAIGKAYEDVGFVAVKNHGVPDELIAQQYEYVQQFFALPLEKKLGYEIPGLSGQRGYTSFGREHAKAVPPSAGGSPAISPTKTAAITPTHSTA